jgi:hypothetical protein
MMIVMMMLIYFKVILIYLNVLELGNKSLFIYN